MELLYLRLHPNFGTSGAFDKCLVREKSGIYLIKRGSDIASNSGLEPYGEVLASQIFARMKAGVPYKLVKYHDKVASKCKLFNNEDISFVPFSMKYSNIVNVSAIVDAYASVPNSDMIRRILICDGITFNTDRHAGNHGELVSAMTNEVMFAAPGYDYNLSMFPYVVRDDFADVTTMVNKYVPRIGNSFIAVAKGLLTSEIRKDLINLKGIELTLPFYDEKFPEERAKWLTDIVNCQIDNILTNKTPVYPAIKVDGLSNCMKYRMKYHLSEDEWIEKVPHLCALLDVKHVDDLEREIKIFL